MRIVALLLLSAGVASAQFISSDTYTRYELLAPETHQFRIYYEVTETHPGARFYFNPIRPGSVATDESVTDAATGKPLKFEVVTGRQAKADAPEQNFSPEESFIKIYLPRAVPAEGECRLVIEKTYEDAKSYYAEGDLVVFKRSLGIPRNSVVLPAGYQLVSSSVATQALNQPDGRLRLAFVNAGSGGPLEVLIKARMLPAIPKSGAMRPSLTERAYQDREILYELQAPETHAFRIAHDYTARKPGEKDYFNVVRAGSHVTDPESIDLDTGEKLKWEVLSGKEVKARRLAVEERLADDSEVVVTHLARPLPSGATNRVRLKETYADPKSYYMDGDELVWDRSFGRLRNTVVLPPGWYLTALATPATVSTLRDGRVSIYIVNPRNDDVRVSFRARQRPR